MNKLPIIYHPCYEFDSRRELRFPIQKYKNLKTHLEEINLLSELNLFTPIALTKNQISISHDKQYVDRVFEGALTHKEKRVIGLPFLDYFGKRAFVSSGGTLLAAKLALKFNIALNLAGGSHHAGKNSGSGFCVFNDVAVACNCLLQEGLINRAVILDLDVHQGDGTAEILSTNDKVLTLSIHCEKNFPARKKNSNLDIGLAAGTSDLDYLEALDYALQRIVAFCPDIIFYNCGVDVHRDDNLGYLCLSTAGIETRERKVLDFAQTNRVPVAVVLGGGYQKDIVKLVKLHSIVFREAAVRYDIDK